ncbi:hypothetical protein BGZ73_008160 [Actinomortierella ambigua]|nr:hypothetical protein BGZ73_008160 [Actinomortierella ambigua]
MASFIRTTVSIAARQTYSARLPPRNTPSLFTVVKKQKLSTSATSKTSRASKPIDITTTARSQTTIDPKNPISSSSPIFARSHPFLRKFQAGCSPTTAFSTSASMKDTNKDTGSHPTSPTVAAANATEALFEKRLQECLHKQRHEQENGDYPYHGNCGCDDGHTASSTEFGIYHGSDDEGSIDFAIPPPISDEARRFTDQLLGQNKAWAERINRERPGFFTKLEKQQTPQVLWIGCSDSRVPANQIVNLDPGEVFVHRNIANVVTHTDMNLLSVVEYAVDVLKVRHIIVCGHYGCGGVAASLTQKNFGVIDNWLRNIKDLYTIHRKKFDKLPRGGKEQQDLLTELNVIQSALNVGHTSTIQKAWARGAEVSIHAWCYRLSDGKIRNLGLCIEGPGATEDVYHVVPH